MVPLYIMSVKRWVQVCTCTDSSVQIHSQSNPSWHHTPVIACIWLAMTIILTVYFTCDKIKFYGSFCVLSKNIKDLNILIIVKYSIINISACEIDSLHSDPKKYAIYWHGY